MKAASGALLAKAERAVRAAELLLKEGDFDASINRAYYGLFYTAEALLIEKGLSFRKHGGVHAAIGEHFVKPGLLDQKFHQWLLDAFDKRIVADYGVSASLTHDEARQAIQRAEEFVQLVRGRLGIA